LITPPLIFAQFTLTNKYIVLLSPLSRFPSLQATFGLPLRSRGLTKPLPHPTPRSSHVTRNSPASAVVPHEAPFEPGDTGFSAPTSAHIVGTSAGTVMVKITARFTGAEGDKVVAVGGCRALGRWEPDAAPSLTLCKGDFWTATLELPPGTHEFKVRRVTVTM
jgi:hypothetical protein